MKLKRDIRELSNLTKLLLKAAGITCIAFILSFLLVSPFAASISAVFSSPEKRDFTMPDLYMQVADGRPVRHLEDKLAIVNVDRSNREEIADILQTIAICEPRGIVVDINFEFPSENDSLLLNTLRAIPNLILPLGVDEKADRHYAIADKPFFYGELPNARYGAVNLPTSSNGTTVRDYVTGFEIAPGDTLPSLAMAAARDFYPDSTTDSFFSEGLTFPIAYHSREIPVIYFADLIDHAEELTGKIIMVGATGEVTDTYPTPIHTSLSGVEVHAYALSTILSNAHFRQTPKIYDMISAILFCYILVLATISIKSGIRGLVIRIIQVVSLYLIVRVGYHMFIDRSNLVDFSQTLLMTAFGLFATDLWNGTSVLISWICKLPRLFRKKNAI